MLHATRLGPGPPGGAEGRQDQDEDEATLEGQWGSPDGSRIGMVDWGFQCVQLLPEPIRLMEPRGFRNQYDVGII